MKGKAGMEKGRKYQLFHAFGKKWVIFFLLSYGQQFYFFEEIGKRLSSPNVFNIGIISELHFSG